MSEYRMPQWDVLEAMELYGGSFVKQLAVLFRLADPENRLRLANTFRDVFQKYDEMAAIRATQPPQPIREVR